MTSRSRACPEFEPHILAEAGGEGDPQTSLRLEAHVSGCAACRQELLHYRAIEAGIGSLTRSGEDVPEAARSREELESRLADLRRRLVRYRIFSSPLGPLLLARTEQGVLLVEYLEKGRSLASSRLGRMPGLDVIEDHGDVEAVYRELRDYLSGRRTRLDWPLDLRLARTDFHRKVLERTHAIPYGAVLSYAGLAREIGRPGAFRAVAQALRWNPLAIVIPCHRIVGSAGDLTGYAGGTTARKRQLLAVEGVPAVRARGDFRVRREAMYILAPGEREYCLPSCRSIEEADPFPLGGALFSSRARAEEAGLKPCVTCRPDLHPLEA